MSINYILTNEEDAKELEELERTSKGFVSFETVKKKYATKIV